jgi:anti-anti-sigma regulatory factor
VISSEVWKDSGIGLIELDGVLDADAVPALRQAFDEATQLAANHTILGALLTRHELLRDHGGTLAVIGTGGVIAHLLRRVGIGESVPLFASLDDALATLTGKADP